MRTRQPYLAEVAAKFSPMDEEKLAKTNVASTHNGHSLHWWCTDALHACGSRAAWLLMAWLEGGFG